jgi:hypothetical protein
VVLPNFLIVGAQKAGTTSLHDILSQHPQAYMSEVKEINYFTNEQKYKKGLVYYSSFFKKILPQHIVVGESSPGYMCYPQVAERIRKELGDIKIVMILRDPIRRAFSQYWDNRRHLSETFTEYEIVSNFLEIDYQPGRRGYFSRGVYIRYIEKFQEFFSKENVHILLLEELVMDQSRELRRLYNFLGIDETMGLQTLPPPSNSSNVWLNPFYSFFFQNPVYTKYLPSKVRRLLFFGEIKPYRYQLPSDDILMRLKSFYKPWNEKLSNELKLNIDKWIL